ncbi:hypothetical protein JW926_15780, partial [Candidatus Sumerlaeota bacterium]|nr:hypothetical protein [Candidatus Sumerlaeota bacterium]
MAKRKTKSAKAAFDFKVNETVVEPTVGICQLEGIRRMAVDGKEENYYIFKASNSRVLVPRSQIDKRGIRRPMTKDDVKKIFAF